MDLCRTAHLRSPWHAKQQDIRETKPEEVAQSCGVVNDGYINRLISLNMTHAGTDQGPGNVNIGRTSMRWKQGSGPQMTVLPELRRHGGPTSAVAARNGVGFTSLEAFSVELKRGTGNRRFLVPAGLAEKTIETGEQLQWVIFPEGAGPQEQKRRMR